MLKARISRGLVHVYTGDGKGKTTAALGIALRALGWGLKVFVVQFIKGYPKIGEIMVAERLAGQFGIRQFAIDLTRDIDEAKVLARKAEAEAAMQFAEELVASANYDIVILDEINNAVHYGLIPIDRVLTLIKTKPPLTELILTGRDATQAIIDAADYVTEMRLVKHPYEKGIQARPGIDY